MSLIFAPGKYLILILLFADIFFSISPDIVESPQKSVVPFLHSSLFCCKVLLSALSVGVVWIPCLVLTCSLLTCFAVCFTSITGSSYFLNCGERLMFGRFINYNFKIYTRWFTTNAFSTTRCIKFANYWTGIFSFIKFDFSWTKLEWRGVVWKFLFPCWCS